MAELEFEDILPYVEGEGDTGKTAREKIKRNFDKLKPLGELPGEVQQVKREVKRKAELIDTEEDGAFFCDENGKVFLEYDNEHGLDANKVSEHFKELVAPDLTPYPTTEEVEEMIEESGQSEQSGLVNTTESGAFFCDDSGKVFMKYDNEHGLDVNKVSEHLKGLIADGETSHDTAKSLTIPTLSSTKQTLAIPDIKYNSVYSFFGKVSTWGETSELVIQRGNPSASLFSQAGTVITINSSKIVVNNGGTTTEYTHGLTISDILMVDIIVSSSVNSTPEIVTNAKIVMITSSGVYIAEHTGFKGCKDSVAVYVNNGTMTGCVLSWSSPDLNKDIWVFGDSYLDYWVKHIMSFGANNALFDGFSGRTCQVAIASFNKLVPSLGKPKAIVWAMGMNNGDTNNAVNATWLTTFQQVEAACASNGIELYVCTIPNALPTVDNSYKNAYIRQSEHKIIDVSEAVGADTLTNWYSNFRGTNGNIHPSVTGAKVIAAKILQCLPTLIK